MAKFPNVEDLKECPICGGDEYYVLSKPIGKFITRYNFDGSDADNTEMLSSLSDEPQKFVYCSDCEVKIARNIKS